MAKETYAKAQARLSAALIERGWKPSPPGLKTSYVTSGDGQTRLEWTPQSAYVRACDVRPISQCERSSLHLDYRGASVDSLLDAIKRRAG